MRTITIEYSEESGIVIAAIKLEGKYLIPEIAHLPLDLTVTERRICVAMIEAAQILTGGHVEE